MGNVTRLCVSVRSQADDKLLTEGVIPKSYGKLMTKAKDTCEKLMKSGQCLVKEACLRDKVPQMKAAWTTLNKALSDIQHVVMFEELPNSLPITKDNLEAFVKDIAKNCDKINCEVETYKAIMRAKSV